MAKVFTSIEVYPHDPQQTLVVWRLHPDFTEDGPYVFTVQVSRSASSAPGSAGGEWHDVATVTDSPAATFSTADTVQRGWSTAENWFYRVLLTLPDGRQWISYAEPAWGTLPRRERLIVRDIYRRERLRLVKTGAGSVGLLLKRRHWGTPCTKPGCVDQDTVEVKNPQCDVCFGTGFVGGYYAPISYWVDFTAGESRYIKGGDTGTADIRVNQGRGLAWPLPMTYDLWINQAGGDRYAVHTFSRVTEVRSVPVILQLQMRPLPDTDVAYTVPLPSDS